MKQFLLKKQWMSKSIVSFHSKQLLLLFFLNLFVTYPAVLEGCSSCATCRPDKSCRYIPLPLIHMQKLPFSSLIRWSDAQCKHICVSTRQSKAEGHSVHGVCETTAVKWNAPPIRSQEERDFAVFVPLHEAHSVFSFPSELQCTKQRER